MDRALRRMLKSTIYVRSVVAYSPTGHETLSAARAIKAHVELATVTVPVEGGTERKTVTRIICESEIGESDRVWLPGKDPDDDTAGRAVDKVLGFQSPTGDGIDHYEVFL